MKKTKIIIPEGIIYLGDYPNLISQLPTTSFIFAKKMTGCGATTLFLEDDVPTVLCSPRNELVHCKANSDRHIGNVHAFGYETKTTGQNIEVTQTDESVIDKINAMKDYVSQRLPQPLCPPPPAPKIIVTYDSCKHVIQGLKEIGELGSFRFVVDEFQSLWMDAGFRGNVAAEFAENLKCVNPVIYLSATPYIEKYLDQMEEFKNLPFVELQWPQSSLHYTNTVKKQYLHGSQAQTIAKIISDYRTNGYFNNNIIDEYGNAIPAEQGIFFVNDVQFIIDTIKKNGLTPQDTLVICGDCDDNAKKLSKIGFSIGHAPKEGKTHPTFTFSTKCAYLGTDFNHLTGYAYVFSDIRRDNMSVDISLDLAQIYGRLRVSPYRYNATFYCRTLPDFSEEEQRKFEEEITQKANTTNATVDFYENIQDSRVREATARKVKQSQKIERYKNDYIDVVDDKTYKKAKFVFNKYAFINELRAFEVQKSQYSNDTCILGQINQAVNHDAHKDVIAFKSTFIGPFENRMRLYSEFLDLHPECNKDLMNDASIPRVFKLAYNRLGTNYLKSLHWSESAIEEALARGTSALGMDMVSVIRTTFQVGYCYLLTSIKSTLQAIFNDYQPGRTAKATDLEQWFVVREVKATDNNGKRQRGYRIEGRK